MRFDKLAIARFGGEVSGLSGAAVGQASRAGLLVRVTDDGGGWGQGEASPLPGFSTDTLEMCFKQLSRIATDKIARDFTAPIETWLEQALAESEVTAPAARFALETALLDWRGRHSDASIAKLLGGKEAVARSVPLAALVADMASAQTAFARGIRTFKIKISPATWSGAMSLGAALRREYGKSVSLRFDANRTLALPDVAAQLRELAQLAPEFIEEPVGGDELVSLAGAPVALAADESLAKPASWPQLARVCQVIVLKPALLGGLCACLKLARYATARGANVVVTHMFDGPIALAAAAELAVALPGRVLACGLEQHPGLAAWPAVHVPQVRSDHVASARLPGLGLPRLS